MPEHIHLLLSEPERATLSRAIQALKQSVSQKLKAPDGHFWQARYYDFSVFTPAKRVEKLKYIHRNPVHRGLVERPEDWPWSSYRHYALGELGTVQIESPSRRGSGAKSGTRTFSHSQAIEVVPASESHRDVTHVLSHEAVKR